MSGWWDGVQQFQVTDAFNVLATRHGLDWNAAYDPTSTYDNFVVRVAP